MGKGAGQAQEPWSHILAVSHELSDAGELHHFPRPRSLLWRVGTNAPPLLGRTTVKWLSALQSPSRQCPCMSHMHKP